MNEVDGIKKFKAPMKLEGKPVYILADDIDIARDLLRKQFIRMGNTIVESSAFELTQVDFSEVFNEK